MRLGPLCRRFPRCLLGTFRLFITQTFRISPIPNPLLPPILSPSSPPLPSSQCLPLPEALSTVSHQHSPGRTERLVQPPHDFLGQARQHHYSSDDGHLASQKSSIRYEYALSASKSPELMRPLLHSALCHSRLQKCVSTFRLGQNVYFCR